MTAYSKFIQDYIINIPAIQRDYVQGAYVNRTKRNEFIKVILEKLDKGEQFGLEFIYGSSKKSEKDDNSYFIPIDGQQRLTTLALLGWILARRAYTEEERKEFPLRPMEYSVRSTTQLFVKHLFESDIPLESDAQTLSEYIKTVPSWFAKKWENDPSVCAMLDILDELDVRLKNLPVEQCRRMADNLFCNPVIVFDSLDMVDYGLTEDLYVKMNARGKHLTEFENWKAEFYGFLKSVYDAEVADKFSERIEGDWCNLFWGYALTEWDKRGDKERLYPRIDEFFMRFYKYMTETIYLSQTDIKKRAEELRVDNSKVLQKDPKADIFELYKIRDNVDELFEVIDALAAIGKHDTIDHWLSEILTDTFDAEDEKERINIFAETDIFRRLICGEEVTLPLRVLFYAILKRIVKPGYENLAETKDYVRVFWGWVMSKNWRNGSDMTYAYNIRVEDFRDAREVIDELSVYPNAFEALERSTLKSLEGEKYKVSWRMRDKYDAVRILSGHPYLKGNLGNIYPALEQLTAQEVVSRFVDFAEKKDHEKVCILLSYGFRGALSNSSNYRFYGVNEHWDYVFTCSNENVRNAVKSMLLQGCEQKTFTADEFEYYMMKYPNILTPKGYFYIEDDFTVWGLERFTGRRGYNSCPYCRIVVERMKSSPLKLQQYAADSSHGSLWSESLGLQLECRAKGWYVSIYDKTTWTKYPHAMKFESYIEQVIPDASGKDRIETAIKFLDKLIINS